MSAAIGRILAVLRAINRCAVYAKQPLARGGAVRGTWTSPSVSANLSDASLSNQVQGSSSGGHCAFILSIVTAEGLRPVARARCQPERFEQFEHRPKPRDQLTLRALEKAGVSKVPESRFSAPFFGRLHPMLPEPNGRRGSRNEGGSQDARSASVSGGASAASTGSASAKPARTTCPGERRHGGVSASSPDQHGLYRLLSPLTLDPSPGPDRPQSPIRRGREYQTLTHGRIGRQQPGGSGPGSIHRRAA